MSAMSSWGARALVFMTSCLGALSSACLDRPLCSDQCEPKTTNQFVLRVPTGGIKKLDFLFMIDNSASMADKQKLLRSAVPSLVSRFVEPLCLDKDGNPNGAKFQGDRCAMGVPQFPPVNDIHIAVITSSLGALGSKGQCAAATVPDNDDKAWLLPKARPAANLPSWNGSGFLNWDPKGASQPNGTKEPRTLATEFQNLVAAAGEVGCGYEASLESWYRFLVDPDPAESIGASGPSGAIAAKVGLDQQLLAQRSQFLRPDSLLAIVMLTDENDCSLRVGTSGAVIAGERMHAPTAACAQNPDDPCCRSCGTLDDKPPAGCAPISEDASCKLGTIAYDPANLRCWDQKRRFGADFLEPTGKYVRGLTQKTVPDRNNQEQPNPLFVGGRSPDLVYLAGIVGVPWQDIATDDSLTGPGLKYLTPTELNAKKRWEVILGDPKTRKPPSDPHMVESPTPRSGSHPFLAQAAIAPPEATSPRADVISGHEQLPSDVGDLQYACIFELETPTNCTGTNCDCSNATLAAKRSLCQPPSGGPQGTTQYFAKAYPGLRQLEVLQGIGDQAIVASICPKVPRSANPDADANFGYNPAMDALVQRLIPFLANQCLGRAPEVDEQGRTSCVVLEAKLSGTCDCAKTGRQMPEADSLNSVRDDLRGSRCDVPNDPNSPKCSDVCACQLNETEGTALSACRTANDPGIQAPGFCYVDPEKGLGDPALVQTCPDNKRRLLRFVGPDTPTSGTIAYMACMGRTLTD